MSIVEHVEHVTTAERTDVGATPVSAATRAALEEELRLKIDLGIEGISVDPGAFDGLGIGTEVTEQFHLLFDMNRTHQPGVDLPAAFFLPHGLFVEFRLDERSKYRLRREDGAPVLYELSYDHPPRRLAEIEFYRRSPLLSLTTTDGQPYGNIADFGPEGQIFVCYSNECALKDRGRDCLYCNINATAAAYSDRGIFLKNARQVGEVFAAAHALGVANHINVTGGYIPERRELEYYADVAEEIRERTGLDTINGTAVVGAPRDLGVIEKYREAGYTTIAHNIEIWDRHIWKAICPGKDLDSGGWDQWVKALHRSAEVFGFGRVRSNIVAGIEPKSSLLEGLEYLASIGVVCGAGTWCPNPGSELEGHRTPELDWHLDVNLRLEAIYRGVGFTLEDIYDCQAAATPVHDLYRIHDDAQYDGDRLRQWTFRPQGTAPTSTIATARPAGPPAPAPLQEDPR